MTNYRGIRVIGSPCKLCYIILDENIAAKNKTVKGVLYYKTYCRKCISLINTDRLKSNPTKHAKLLEYFRVYNRYRRKRKRNKSAETY